MYYKMLSLPLNDLVNAIAHGYMQCFGLVDSMDDDGAKDLVIDEQLHDKDAVRWNQSHDAEL